VPEGITVGDPDQVAERIARWESIGVDRINFVVNSPGSVAQSDILASMRLFAAEVMPRFDRDSHPTSGPVAEVVVS
jgi:alkanesulfonate monooxygenase SsuD/methylene tetrahydromethanopterin reductase-like flavin-dependent oxidoreductase (luciferase family)